MIDVYESLLYQFGGMGVIDFVALCISHIRY